jgi:predicted transcriptional regulator of viral defense system
LDDIDVAVALDRQTGWWQVTGTGDEARRSHQQNAIVLALKEPGQPISPKEIADRSGVSREVVRHLVRKLTEQGTIEQVGTGLYLYPVHSIHAIHTAPVSELSL